MGQPTTPRNRGIRALDERMPPRLRGGLTSPRCPRALTFSSIHLPTPTACKAVPPRPQGRITATDFGLHPHTYLSFERHTDPLGTSDYSPTSWEWKVRIPWRSRLTCPGLYQGVPHSSYGPPRPVIHDMPLRLTRAFSALIPSPNRYHLLRPFQLGPHATTEA